MPNYIQGTLVFLYDTCFLLFHHRLRGTDLSTSRVSENFSISQSPSRVKKGRSPLLISRSWYPFAPSLLRNTSVHYQFIIFFSQGILMLLLKLIVPDHVHLEQSKFCLYCNCFANSYFEYTCEGIQL